MQMQFSEENNLFLFLFACARKQAALFVLLQRSTRNISKWTLRENNDIITMTFSGTSFNKISYINSSLNERNTREQMSSWSILSESLFGLLV